MSWFEANEHCKSIGANLVEIDSEEENEAIVEEIHRRGYRSLFSWIGLTDKDEEGTWTLASNGTKAKYLNWDKSYRTKPEPNNDNGNEHCAHIRAGNCLDLEWRMGAWADLNCNKDTLVIPCQWKSLHMSMTAICEFGLQAEVQPVKGGSSETGETGEEYHTFWMQH